MYSIVEPWVREKACELKPMVCNDESKHAFVRLLSLLVLVLGPLGALSSAWHLTLCSHLWQRQSYTYMYMLIKSYRLLHFFYIDWETFPDKTRKQHTYVFY